VDSLLAGIAAKQRITFISAGDWLTRYNLAQHLADSVHMDGEGRTALSAVLERRFRESGIPNAAPKPAAAPVPETPGGSKKG
jgi:acyl-CoA thioesterase-1